MKRTIMEIRQIDYTSELEFKADVPKMRKRGWQLIDLSKNSFPKSLQHGAITGDDYWHYTAYFYKSYLE